jgi:outer membrane autotransporter protein
VNLHTDGFTENGGAAALVGRGGDTDTTFTALGLRASTTVVLGGITTHARGSIGWRHAFGDVTPISTLSFSGGNPFYIAGVPIAKDAALVDAGLDFNITPNADLGVSYGGQFGPDANEQSVRGTLSVKF